MLLSSSSIPAINGIEGEINVHLIYVFRWHSNNGTYSDELHQCIYTCWTIDHKTCYYLPFILGLQALFLLVKILGLLLQCHFSKNYSHQQFTLSHAKQTYATISKVPYHGKVKRENIRERNTCGSENRWETIYAKGTISTLYFVFKILNHCAMGQKAL